MKQVSVLKLARLRAGMTQFDLGRLVGVSEMSISRIERGRLDPAPYLRKALAKHLGISSFEVTGFVDRESSVED